MQLSRELVAHAFTKYIESTSNRFNIESDIIYSETLKSFDEPNMQVPICMFIYGYIKAKEPLILDEDISFEFIKEVVLEELQAKA